MPFERPTLAQLIERSQGDFKAQLAGSEPSLRRSLVGVLARVHAGGMHTLHGRLIWITKQLFPDTSEDEYLEREASFFSLSKVESAKAIGSATATGVNGTVIPQGKLWQRADGVEYTQDADATIADGTATIAVTAVKAGVDGNAAAGIKLTVAAALLGLDSEATVIGDGLTGGRDLESIESLRSRLLTRKRKQPQGGADADYEAWVREARPSATGVWVYPSGLGPGTVVIRFAMYDDYANGIPLEADVTAVQAHINTKKPVHVPVYVYAPTESLVPLTIKILPNNVAVQDAIEAELADLFRTEGTPGGTIPLSHVDEAISRAAGEEDHLVVVPAGDIEMDPGNLPVLSVITWQNL